MREEQKKAPASREKQAKKQGNRLKIRDETYKVGDCAYVTERKRIARIDAIDFPPDQSTPVFLDVTWQALESHRRFYKKADMEQCSALTAEERKFMADAEVFEVNAKSRITSRQITGKCYVWSIEEYDEEPRVSLDVFYTRGKYDLFLVHSHSP